MLDLVDELADVSEGSTVLVLEESEFPLCEVTDDTALTVEDEEDDDDDEECEDDDDDEVRVDDDDDDDDDVVEDEDDDVDFGLTRDALDDMVSPATAAFKYTWK